MKKLLLRGFVFTFFLIVNINLAAAEKKVLEFSVDMGDYVRVLENYLCDYWRYPETEKNVSLTANYENVLTTFKEAGKKWNELFKYSGLYSLRNVDGISVKYYDANHPESFYFRNKIKIFFTEQSDGFLTSLMKPLPPAKRVVEKKEKEEDKDLSDFYLIDDNTLLLFSLPLNFNEALKAMPQDMEMRHLLSDFASQYMSMSLEEFADQLTGEWGGFVQAKYDRQRKLKIAFVFMIPDRGQKLFHRLGEYFFMKRQGRYDADKKILKLSLLRNYPDLSVFSADEHLFIFSGTDMMIDFSRRVNNRTVCSKINRLQVPIQQQYPAMIYYNDDFSGAVFSLFSRRPLPSLFLRKYIGSDSVNFIYPGKNELLIDQYSTKSVHESVFAPNIISALVQYDNFYFTEAKKNSAVRSKNSDRFKCRVQMSRIAGYLKNYAAAHNGHYPQGINKSGLEKLAVFSRISPDIFSVKAGGKFDRYYYWGENFNCKKTDIPLLCDRGGIHEEYIHILFCDGSVREFKLTNIRSARRIISYLHTVYNYDNETFMMLLKQAERLDSEKL